MTYAAPHLQMTARRTQNVDREVCVTLTLAHVNAKLRIVAPHVIFASVEGSGQAARILVMRKTRATAMAGTRPALCVCIYMYVYTYIHVCV